MRQKRDKGVSKAWANKHKREVQRKFGKTFILITQKKYIVNSRSLVKVYQVKVQKYASLSPIHNVERATKMTIP